MNVTLLNNLPLELRKGVRYVCWRSEQIRAGIWNTVPVDLHTGNDAASDDPSIWSTWDEAVAFYSAHQHSVLGIGRWLFASDVPAMLAIEFMDCLDEQGHLVRNHPAAQWVPKLDSYAEVSPNGTGVIVWVYATHDLGGRSERKSGTVVIYRERQFLPLTGQRLTKYSGIVEWCQPVVNGLYAATFGAEEVCSKSGPPLWRRQSFVPPPTPTTVSTDARPYAPTPTLKIDAAKSFLEGRLANGPVDQARLIAAAKDKGITEITLRRAKRALRVRSTRRTYQGHVVWDYRR